MGIRAKLLWIVVATTGLLGLYLFGRYRSMSARHRDASAPGAFRDVTRAAGLHFRYDNDATPQRRFIETTGGGVAFLDYNGDGHLDIFAVQGGPASEKRPPNAPHCALYRNRGDGTWRMRWASRFFRSRGVLAWS